MLVDLMGRKVALVTLYQVLCRRLCKTEALRSLKLGVHIHHHHRSVKTLIKLAISM